MRSWNVSAPPSRQKGLQARRPRYIAARAFYLTIFIILAFAVCATVISSSSAAIPGVYDKIVRRAGSSTQSRQANGANGRYAIKDQECRLVHAAKDQCAFVRVNCTDEDAFLFSYLQLYFCRLPNAKPVAFIILTIWLGFLFSTIGIAASDFFCINLSTIASTLGMSESMAGVTFLAFGNGSPDVFSTFAAMKTHSGSLAVGELIGAAGFITAVVAGSMALVRPFKVARKSFIRDVGFFIVAASFSMVFLADGHLDLWECAVMVGFYVFYVITVVVWHWYLRRTSHRRILEDEARSHFEIPGIDDDVVESYHDEEDAAAASTRAVSIDDFANLERGSPMLRAMDEEVEADDNTRDRYLAQISSNMRVSRPARSPRNTLNPIRPSLVGALEFRAVLSSLQKSRNIQSIPINLRRYSDDPTLTVAQQHDNQVTPADHNSNINASSVLNIQGHRAGHNRVRAVSTNDAPILHPNAAPRAFQGLGGPRVDNKGPSAPSDTGLQPPQAHEQIHVLPAKGLGLPTLLIPDPDGENGYLAHSPLPMSPLDRRESTDLLAPPPEGLSSLVDPPEQRLHSSARRSGSGPTQPKVPRIHIPRSSEASHQPSPLSPFPAYYDDPNFIPSSLRSQSIRLPPTSAGSDSAFRQHLCQEPNNKPTRWWPYKVLPPPQFLISTLFPTLYSWKEKNVWEKMLGIVAAPSVFFLAVTLPVVEIEKDEEEDLPSVAYPDPGLLEPEDHLRRDSNLTLLLTDSPKASMKNNHAEVNALDVRKSSNNGTASPAINITVPSDGNLSPQAENSDGPNPFKPQDQSSSPSPPSCPKDWNRWLVATQIFTAPFFVVFIIWANTDPSLSTKNLVLPSLYALICSLVAFALLVIFTAPSQPPKHRHLLCYLGFIVAIAWISTIANEVVGVLKALGIILNISDAILGLTIFAVGNSLGDLVADITVARLGYPVMALSACFGGPMLNILLGIGISGLYMTIQGAERRREKHPGRPPKFKPYQIEVGGTLLISGVTLLVTLAGLLIVVPLRGWWMDRKVGWGLVILWALSTIGNVIVEVVGWDVES